MGLAFNGVTIPDATIEEVTRGLEGEELAQADSICTKVTNVTAHKGDIPGLDQYSTTSRKGQNSDLGRGEEAKPHGGAAIQTDYRCKAQVGMTEIHDEDRAQWEAFGEDWLASRIRQARADSNFHVDCKLVRTLESTTLNNTFDLVTDPLAGNGPWTDEVNSTPLKDLLAMIYGPAKGTDMIIYGPAVMRALLKHPDIIAEYSHFNAGQLDITGLRSLLSSKTGIPVANIVEFKVLFNDVDEGELDGNGDFNFKPEYLFDNGFWLGKKSDLLMVDPSNVPGQPAHNNITEIERQALRRLHCVVHNRYIDIVRPYKNLGLYVPNAIA